MIQNTNNFVSLHPPGDTPSDHIRRGIFYEEDIFIKILQHIPTTGVFLDIGANIGNHSLMFHQYFSNNLIYSFEANPYNYVHLASNTKSTSNIVTICTVLGNEEQLAEFIHFPPSPGSSRLRQHFGADVDRSKLHDYMYGTNINDCVKINVITHKLDSFSLSDITFIKLDVEGHEKQVIEGAKDLIKKYKPVIWIEDFIYNDMNSATQYLINEFGYKVVQEEKDCNFILK